MNPDAMTMAEGVVRQLAAADPLRCCRALLLGMKAAGQSNGAVQIVVAYLTGELKYSNPAPPASAPAGQGSSPGGFAGPPSAAGVNHSNPVCLPPTGSPATSATPPAGGDRHVAGRSYRKGRR